MTEFELKKYKRYKCKHCGEELSYGFLTEHLLNEHPEIGKQWLTEKSALAKHFDMLTKKGC